MRILIKNGTIITQNDQREVISRGDVLIYNSEITSLGENLSVEADEVIDAEGLWVLPGLINAHVHLGESIYATLMPRRYSLENYLKRTEEIAEAALVEEKRSVVAKYSALQMLKSGTTCIGGGRTQEAAEALGIRNVSGYMLMLSGKLGHFFKDLAAGLNSPLDHPASALTSHAIFIHSLVTINREMLAAASDLFARDISLRLMVHVGENAIVASEVRRQYGESEIQVLERYNLLDERTIIIHGNHLVEEDLNKIQVHGATLVHCLSSNMNTVDVVIDIKNITERGINVCVATDGVITSSEFSVLREAGNVYKYHNRFLERVPVTARALLDMITINGAKALGLQSKIGSLEVGKMADLIILKPPFGASKNAVVEQIIHYANLIQIEDVMVNGQLVLGKHRSENREHKRIESDFAETISEIEKKATD
jgi:5-methylthioadenosine/S-adenosylhomocysteine deaminase